ncbi:MAG: radical SAM family heme chaperone HemW [Duncaniella sp.]|nr:radical SAM family heme chaperone HemW [Duncaniella sp.]
MMKTASGLYIHIPFCHSKCAYCDFYSVPVRGLTAQFVDALCNELDTRLASWPFEITTVYIGGGTPSSLSDDMLRRIVDRLPMNRFDEFTIEVNPEDVTRERARAWLGMGIGRVSMGVQSLDDDVLRAIGRRHSAADAINAYRTLRESGFTNVSLDLIYGLPGQTVEGWCDTLNHILELRPEHLSAYSLSYEDGTRLNAMRLAGKIAETPAEEVERMYELLTENARKAGYHHYEISNFAIPGREAIHNSRYWDMTPYLGVGPGAHGWDGRKRSYNTPSVKEYIGGRGIESRHIEEENESERFNDMVFTALRTDAGLDIGKVSATFGAKRTADILRTARRRHLSAGNVILTPGRLIIPESRWLISNDIISDFMEV